MIHAGEFIVARPNGPALLREAMASLPDRRATSGGTNLPVTRSNSTGDRIVIVTAGETANVC
jgi:hypothetical protein